MAKESGIDATAEKVLAMPSDAQFYLSRTFPNIGKTLQGYGNTPFVSDLQAMASFWQMRGEIVDALESAQVEYQSNHADLCPNVQPLITKIKEIGE